MGQIIGEAKHEPQVKVVVNQAHEIGGTALLVKSGIESVAKDRWRVWYSPIIGKPTEVTYLTAPPGGLTIERARVLAQSAAMMQSTAVRVAIDQVAEDTQKTIVAVKE